MKKTKRKLSHSLFAISILPLLLFGIFIILLASYSFTKTIHKEVESELYRVSNIIITLLDTAYPGDYYLDETSSNLYKGETNLASGSPLLEHINEDTGIEITLFYGNERMLTTIRDSGGQHIVGSLASSKVTEEVLEHGNPQFYSDISIDNMLFFGYYTPLYHSNGTIIGMLFVGKTSQTVQLSIFDSIFPIFLAGVICLLFTCIIVLFFAKNIINGLIHIREFLIKVSTGDLNTKLSADILQRNDELGEIGSSAISMQRSLRTLVEHDMLTGLYNRRSGENILKKNIEQASKKPFVVVIGDIDFFKNVNDTYGHEGGDLVLKGIANILREHMDEKGYAVRWGGEEFLLVYENMTVDTAYKYLKQLLSSIRNLTITYQNFTIQVTMTFGLADSVNSIPEHLVKKADDKLYQGKISGRDRIVT